MFQRLKGASGAESLEPRLTLGAFGKHPGWDDHILDRQRDLGLGPETETLAQVKQALYAVGLRGQIDSGAWEKLEPEKRLAGFDHTFLWLRPGHAIIGQLWSSTDGKGRAKYPMLLCIDGEGVSPAFMFASLLPGLERLQEACRATTSADQVKRDCRAAQEQLQTVLAGGAPDTSGTLPPLEARQKFLERPELGPDSLGLLRILHELNSGPFASAGGRGSGPATVGTQSRHLRVPTAHTARDEALLLWAAFLRAAVPESVPLLLLARAGTDWLDVILGEPATDDFFCFQASVKALPLATEIPYALSPELKPRFHEIEAKFLGLPIPAAAPASTPVPKTTPPPPKPSAGPAPAKRSRKLPLWLGGGAVLLVALGAGVWMSGVGRRSASPAPAVANISPAPAPAPAITPQPAEPKPSPASALPAKSPPVPTAVAEVKLTATDPAFQNALTAAQAALKAQDYSNAIIQFEAALKIKPDPAVMQQLSEARQAALAAQQQQSFQKALDAGQLALQQKNYAEAVAQALLARTFKPNNSAASNLLRAAQQAQQAAALAQQQQQQFQAATQAALDALAQKNFPAASNQAFLALMLKPDDAVASKLMADAKKGLLPPAAAPPPAPSTPPVAPPSPAISPTVPPATAADRPPFANTIGMEFVWIPGVPPSGAYVGKCEITQKQFRTIVGKVPLLDPLVQGDDLPVANVSFQEAKDFCARLSQREGKKYVLPSRDEWLAFSGLSPNQVTTAWATLAADGRLANEVTSWNLTPMLQRPARVGSRGPQANGLCDLFGNVREWVAGSAGEESAGFAYNSSGGATKQLFLAGRSQDWVQPATGLRCLLRDNP